MRLYCCEDPALRPDPRGRLRSLQDLPRILLQSGRFAIRCAWATQIRRTFALILDKQRRAKGNAFETMSHGELVQRNGACNLVQKCPARRRWQLHVMRLAILFNNSCMPFTIDRYA